MPIEFVVLQIRSANGSLKKLVAFVKDDMSAMLEKIGRLEYQAAINALADAKKSTNPEREINSAITCLRLSYEKFYANATNRSFSRRLGNSLKSALTLGMAKPKSVSSAEGAVECCLMLAACYKTVKDPELAVGFLAKAKQAFEVFVYESCEAAANAAGLSGIHSSRDILRRQESRSLEDTRTMVHALCDEIAATA